MKKTLFLLVLFINLFVAQNVSAQDTTPPDTPVLADVTVNCGVTITAPTTTDNVDPVVTGTTSDPLTYTYYPEGNNMHVIHWVFTDLSLNTTTANQTVVVTGPDKPTLACYEQASFNPATCKWEISGTQKEKPAKVNCYDDFQFDTEMCDWVNIGVKDQEPVKENCWDMFEFSSESCTWVNVGVKDQEPVKENCWDMFEFSSESCTWVNVGVKDQEPVKENCWDMFEFSSESCTWVNVGVKDQEPVKENCWDMFEFSSESCTWVNVGVKDQEPVKENCWDMFEFSSESCTWVNVGVKDQEPVKENCWDMFEFSSESCSWVNVGSQVSTPTATAQTFDAPATVANLVAEGDNLSWYAGLTDEVALDPETTLSTGVYYVSQRLGECESERTPVEVTVNEAALTTTVSDDLANALVASGHEDLLVDGKIDNALASQVTSLDLSDMNITDLTGLEVFINLTSLNLANNNLTSLNFGSSDAGKNANAIFLTSLQTLICSGNQLTSLDISGLTSLQNLDCSSNIDLTCITVKDVAAADLNVNWIKDTTASYSTECSKLAIDTSSLNNFSVVAYPNPSKNGFAMEVNTLSQEVLRIKVYDMIGKLVDQMEVNPNMISSQRIGQNYSTGIYNIVVTQENHVQTLRVIKE